MVTRRVERGMATYTNAPHIHIFISSRWLSNSHEWLLPSDPDSVNTISIQFQDGWSHSPSQATVKSLLSKCATNTQSKPCLKAKRTLYRWCNHPLSLPTSLGLLVPPKTQCLWLSPLRSHSISMVATAVSLSLSLLWKGLPGGYRVSNSQMAGHI